jgi:hypothetical protein
MFKFEYLIPVIAYLLGSIPFGYLLVKFIKREDIRTQGSGNIGATNVYRKSRWVGVLTLILEMQPGRQRRRLLPLSGIRSQSGWDLRAGKELPPPAELSSPSPRRRLAQHLLYSSSP